MKKLIEIIKKIFAAFNDFEKENFRDKDKEDFAKKKNTEDQK